jgi:hypothetical protein
VIRQQERHQRRDLVHGAEAIDGVHPRHRLEGGVVERLENRGPDEGGADGVHADALLGVLHRRHLGHADHAVLAGHVGARALEADRAENGGNVHDRAAPCLFHLGNGVAHPVEHAREVDADHLRPVLGRALRQRALLAADPGIVDQKVQPAARLGGEGDHRLHLRGLGDVAAIGVGGPARAPDLLDHGRAILRREVGTDHRGAAAGEFARDFGADARGRAGDEGALAVESDVHVVSFRVTG